MVHVLLRAILLLFVTLCIVRVADKRGGGKAQGASHPHVSCGANREVWKVQSIKNGAPASG